MLVHESARLARAALSKWIVKVLDSFGHPLDSAAGLVTSVGLLASLVLIVNLVWAPSDPLSELGWADELDPVGLGVIAANWAICLACSSGESEWNPKS